MLRSGITAISSTLLSQHLLWCSRTSHRSRRRRSRRCRSGCLRSGRLGGRAGFRTRTCHRTALSLGLLLAALYAGSGNVQILGSFLYGFAAVYVVHDLGAVDLVPGGERARRRKHRAKHHSHRKPANCHLDFTHVPVPPSKGPDLKSRRVSQKSRFAAMINVVLIKPSRSRPPGRTSKRSEIASIQTHFDPNLGGRLSL